MKNRIMLNITTYQEEQLLLADKWFSTYNKLKDSNKKKEMLDRYESRKQELPLAYANRGHTSYSIINQESSQDNSKCGHPIVVKKSCDVEDCKTTNCAEDSVKCDNSSVEHAIVGHKTHSDKSVSLVPKRLFNEPLTKNSVTRAIRFKNKSNAIPDLAADDTGKHPHVITETCKEAECVTKKCQQLCGPREDMNAKGFLTHGPVAGKFSFFMADIDTNKKLGSQYFTENHDKSKKIDSTKASIYEHNKDIKDDLKTTNFIKNYGDKF